jgi:hypothetical protein
MEYRKEKHLFLKNKKISFLWKKMEKKNKNIIAINSSDE